MEDLRLEKLENTVHEHNRRLTDHDALHITARRDIDMMHDLLVETRKQTGVLLELAPSIKNLEDYAGKTYDVFEPLVRYGTTIVKIGAWSMVVWHGIKWAVAKIGLVWP